MIDEKDFELLRGKRLVVKLKRCRLTVDSATGLNQRKDSERHAALEAYRISNDSLDERKDSPKCATSVGTKVKSTSTSVNRDTDVTPRGPSFESLSTESLDLCDTSAKTRRKRARLDAIVVKLHQRVNHQLLANQRPSGASLPLPLNQTHKNSAGDIKDCRIQSEEPDPPDAPPEPADESPAENRLANTTVQTKPTEEKTLQTNEKLTSWQHKTQELHPKTGKRPRFILPLNNSRVNKTFSGVNGVQCMNSFKGFSVPVATALRPINNPSALKLITKVNQQKGNDFISNQNKVLFTFNNAPLISSNMTCAPMCAPASVTNLIDFTQPQHGYLPVTTWLPNYYPSNAAVTCTSVYPTSATNVLIPPNVQQCVFPSANFNPLVPRNMYYRYAF